MRGSVNAPCFAHQNLSYGQGRLLLADVRRNVLGGGESLCLPHLAQVVNKALAYLIA